jgi:hypothetical protein
LEKSKKQFLEASVKRLGNLKKLAEEGKVKLKRFSEKPKEADDLVNSDFNSNTTRREIFEVQLALGVPPKMNLIDKEKKRWEASVGKEVIQAYLESNEALEVIVREFWEQNLSLVEAMSGEEELIDDSSVLELLSKMNKAGVKVAQVRMLLCETVIREGDSFFKESHSYFEEALLDLHCVYKVSSSPSERVAERIAKASKRFRCLEGE